MYLLILYLPFISFFLIGLFGRFIGTNGSNFLSTFNMFLTMLISYVIFYDVSLNGNICFYKLFSWFNVGMLNIQWGFLFDPITSVMLLVVTTISFFVHLYSIDYMKHDFFSSRFMAYLSLFTWFMLILVTADNFLQLFVGWEGVGLVSYLLINFWFTIIEANKSAIKAMIMNRIGDIGLALAMCLIFFEFRSLEYCVIFPLVPYFSNDFFYFFGDYYHVLTIISIFVLIGAIGKSAQFGLHTWLPDAMAGPTPVSALIHAATMVTAGVFVLIRISPILEYSPNGLFFISFIGVFTSFFAAVIGLFQTDLKKIIAYSTCSQLGYMVFVCGLSNYSLSLFHLSNHAFFKALLFLSAGAIIHGMGDEQDIRKYGGLLQILPFSYIMTLIGSFALMGIPFLTGFYSKDLIIETAYASYIFNNSFIYLLSVFSALFTSIYSTRLIFFTFLTKPNGFKKSYQLSHDAPFFMFLTLCSLGLFSLFFGYVLKDFFVGLGTDAWLGSINNISTSNLNLLESEFLNCSIKNIPFIITIFGIIFVFFLNIFFKKIMYSLKNNYILINFLKNLYVFFSYKWFIDVLYNKLIVKYFFLVSYNYVKNIDRGVIELVGPLGIVRSLSKSLSLIKSIQTGFLYNYLFIFIITILLILINFYIKFDIDFLFLYAILVVYSSKIQKR